MSRRSAVIGPRLCGNRVHWTHVTVACATAFAMLFAGGRRLFADPAAATDSPALRFARHDLTRWTESGKPIIDAAAKATADLEAVAKPLADAKAAQAAADKALADATAALTSAEQGKAAALQAVSTALDARKKAESEQSGNAAGLATARSAADAAAAAFETASKQLLTARETKKRAEADKAEADKKVPPLEPPVKPATDAKAAADKLLAEYQTQLKYAQERLAAFEKGTPAPDPTATRLVQTITHDRPVLACRFDPQGNYLFAGAEDNCFHRWDLFTGSAVHPKVHRSWLGTLALAPTAGGIVVTGGHEGKLTWWNGFEQNPPALRTIDAHKGYIRALAVSPDGQFVATAGNDHFVRVWSTADGALVKELAGHTRHVYNCAFHPSGKYLVSGDLLGIVKQWEVGPWTEVRELDAKVLWKYDTGFRADVGGVRCFAFSNDGKYLAAGGITEVSNAFAGVGVPCVVLFDWDSGKQLKVMKPKDAFQGSVFGVRFSPAGDFIVGAGGGGAGGLWFWKLDDDKSFHFVKIPAVAYDMDLHPDGLRLALPLFDKTLRIYDMAPKFETAQAQPASK